MSNSMRIKIKKKFINPLSNRREKEGTELNVPKNQFWLKRLRDGDCEKIKAKSKIKAPKKEPKPEMKDNSKGSK